ncbi:hypothetical protein MKS88_004632 [Plasmodium brasilianum]|uniref:Uncharacterized protein n=2 Tax=Plasmodium (Plasmodium) TaxID=418103 RepID=A0A1A8W7B3_PLAMA|nr:conserved Plasmodium protein, unknown function [Plasmodium malariae]KAI4836827.1 hypothetical protein MKS88_004632 [Plasmodium brasilianum]SBS88884.1 hypothetical protein PMALA_024110 [Plasmodium malariae]SCO94126.1 conserved Plasmodium protein, unknown function [Plasmodium malariae]
MMDKNSEPVGLKTKIDELEKILYKMSFETIENPSNNNDLKDSFYDKLFNEKKVIITEFLNSEKKKSYNHLENIKNNILKKINIINEKNEDIKNQSDILMADRNKNLCCIKNLETKIENIKKIIM